MENKAFLANEMLKTKQKLIKCLLGPEKEPVREVWDQHRNQRENIFHHMYLSTKNTFGSTFPLTTLSKEQVKVI